MYQCAIRTVGGGLLCGMLTCHVALATDILTPASINGGTDPTVLLNQTGNAYQWTIVGNQDDFTVNDATAAKTPFRIGFGCATSTMVLQNGRVGIGTTDPQDKLHILNGGVFFEDTIGGLQSWYISANDFFFNIVDFTNGNAVPFGIEPGAPSKSLFVQASGNIGVGTGTPTAGLHLKKAAQAATAEILARFETSDDAVGSLVISNGSAGNGLFIPKITGKSASQNAAIVNEAIITNDLGASPAIVYNAAKGAGGALVTRPLVVYRNNSVAKATIAANGAITATSFNPVSSRALKHDIKDLDSRQAADAVRQLTPVEFVYNDDESKEKRVGFIAEDVPDLVADADRQSVPIMDVVALLTRVVKDQQQTIEQQQQSLSKQEKRLEERDREQKKLIASLVERLNALENRSTP